jgi:hypothetical protein
VSAHAFQIPLQMISETNPQYEDLFEKHQEVVSDFFSLDDFPTHHSLVALKKYWR